MAKSKQYDFIFYSTGKRGYRRGKLVYNGTVFTYKRPVSRENRVTVMKDQRVRQKFGEKLTAQIK